jgi:2-methylcitrate dehydratase PrpD
VSRDLASAFVDHALGTRTADLPNDAVAATSRFVLDTIAVGIAGAAAPLTSVIRKATLRGKSGSAHVLGPGRIRTDAAAAAFINGFQIHCQEYDCVHEPAVVHPMATIFAALLAECDAGGRSVRGDAFVAALAVAVDVAAGIGIAATGPIRFFRPANAGIFGATLGIARLRGFSAGMARDAMGYALAFNAGTMQAHVEGKPALPVQIANAARSAITACDLAEAGMPGPHDVLEGPFGYYALFEDGFDPSTVLSELGSVWRITEVSHKPFPTGRAAQGGIRLCQQIHAKGMRAEEIERVVLEAPPLIGRLVGRPIQDDMQANYARLCFPYVGAVALLSGQVGLEDFSDDALRRDDVRALGARISVETRDGRPNAFVPQRLTVTLADSRSLEAHTDRLYGSPADPMDRDAQIAKVAACLRFGFGDDGALPRLLEWTDDLPNRDDVRGLSLLASGHEVEDDD